MEAPRVASRRHLYVPDLWPHLDLYTPSSRPAHSGFIASIQVNKPVHMSVPCSHQDDNGNALA